MTNKYTRLAELKSYCQKRETQFLADLLKHINDNNLNFTHIFLKLNSYINVGFFSDYYYPDHQTNSIYRMNEFLYRRLIIYTIENNLEAGKIYNIWGYYHNIFVEERLRVIKTKPLSASMKKQILLDYPEYENLIEFMV